MEYMDNGYTTIPKTIRSSNYIVSDNNTNFHAPSIQCIYGGTLLSTMFMDGIVFSRFEQQCKRINAKK